MILAYILPLLCLVAALFRAPLAAVPLVPPCLAIVAEHLGLVDLSSASHPLRFVVPAVCFTMALGVAWTEMKRPRRHTSAEINAALRESEAIFQETGRRIVRVAPRQMNPRTLAASILILASCAPDVLALLAWRLPGPWILIPFQIGVCMAILGVLLAPERWLPWTK